MATREERLKNRATFLLAYITASRSWGVSYKLRGRSTAATGAQLDGKHTYFTTHPLLHENVAHFNLGSDSYVPTWTGTVQWGSGKTSSVTPSQPELGHIWCLNQALAQLSHQTHLTRSYMKPVMRQWNECCTLRCPSWSERPSDWYTPSLGELLSMSHWSLVTFSNLKSPALVASLSSELLHSPQVEHPTYSAKHHLLKYARADADQAGGAPLWRIAIPH